MVPPCLGSNPKSLARSAIVLVSSLSLIGTSLPPIASISANGFPDKLAPVTSSYFSRRSIICLYLGSEGVIRVSFSASKKLLGTMPSLINASMSSGLKKTFISSKALKKSFCTSLFIKSSNCLVSLALALACACFKAEDIL